MNKHIGLLLLCSFMCKGYTDLETAIMNSDVPAVRELLEGHDRDLEQLAQDVLDDKKSEMGIYHNLWDVAKVSFGSMGAVFSLPLLADLKNDDQLSWGKLGIYRTYA